MKIARRLPLPAAVAVAVVALLAPAAANADSPTCHGDSCTDLDPAQTNCVDDATTIWSTNATTPMQRDDGNTTGLGVLEMRYSAACHANWVRFTNWAGVDETVAMFLSQSQNGGSPWIWRQDSDSAPRGSADNSGRTLSLSSEVSNWTSMISADGTTCMSVDLYNYYDPTEMGGGLEVDPLGNYTAGCIS